MVAAGSYTWDERSIMYKLVESSCPTPETNKTLHGNYTHTKKKNIYTMSAKKDEYYIVRILNIYSWFANVSYLMD